MRITRRKKTDDGLVIPEWARRGWISVRQGGMDGPVDSSIHFRVCPSDGMVTVYFTGQNEDGELFEEIELWDALVVCLGLLGKKQAAADVVRRRLAEDPRDAKLWCALGDALDDESAYEKALEVSGGRSARASRSFVARVASCGRRASRVSTRPVSRRVTTHRSRPHPGKIYISPL